ncbi:MAG: ECF transporter S component [Actinomycetes bacterium]|jgi:energy-coupling factor transport system substrate-specific component
MTTHAIALGRRSRVAIGLVTLVGIAAFVWPLVAAPHSAAIAHAGDAPILFAVLVPLLLVVVLAQLADGNMDAKAIAMLGVLAAVITALRPLGGGVAGIEPIWAVLILGGRALGPGFGFSLGAISMFSSALVTGGVGPWLPFQMIAAAWVGMGAGLLPALRGRRELFLLAAYAGLACLAYGLLLNLWFWPFTAGLPAQLAFIPGAGPLVNLTSWVRFSLVTSLGFDLPRAALTVLAILVAGTPILNSLRRVSRKAAFGAQPTFEPEPATITLDHVTGRMSA